VVEFLDELEKTRDVTARTRNLRLTAIRSFFRYVAFEAPAHAAQIQRLLAIPAKRYPRALVPFLSRPEVDALLAAPDQRTWSGRRDHALILLAVQTGLRLSELTGLHQRDLQFGIGAHVRVIGKGRKERCTPLSKNTRVVLAAWVSEHCNRGTWCWGGAIVADIQRRRRILRIDEVFKKSGVPTHTFVQPAEYDRVLVSLKTPGRCMIIEGPSGIGKTSCVKKAIEDTGLSDSCLFLSARKPEDAGLIKELPSMRAIGVVVVDDFHRLPTEAKQQLTDFIKTLADEEDQSSKVILIGINRAGQTLVEYAPDVLHRVEVVHVGRANVERIREMIELGQRALNCTISIADEISEEAEGSFAMAQVLCHEACLQSRLLETCVGEIAKEVNVSLPCIREAVIAELTPRFFALARDFATGNKLRREGRAPYLNLLRWLSQTPEGVLDTKEAIAANPGLKGSVTQVIDKGQCSQLKRNTLENACLWVR